jgi:hypothetical protein
VQREELGKQKNQLAKEIEPATFWLVAQFFKELYNIIERNNNKISQIIKTV